MDERRQVSILVPRVIDGGKGQGFLSPQSPFAQWEGFTLRQGMCQGDGEPQHRILIESDDLLWCHAQKMVLDMTSAQVEGRILDVQFGIRQEVFLCIESRRREDAVLDVMIDHFVLNSRPFSFFPVKRQPCRKVLVMFCRRGELFGVVNQSMEIDLEMKRFVDGTEESIGVAQILKEIERRRKTRRSEEQFFEHALHAGQDVRRQRNLMLIQAPLLIEVMQGERLVQGLRILFFA